MAIRDWPENERPREKLLCGGPQSLSDAELLAIFLRTGLPGLSAVDLGRSLLRDFGGLKQIFESDKKQFTSHKGLGTSKYVQLQAVLELSRRYLESTLRERTALSSPHHTKSYLRVRLRGLAHEVFAVLFLDKRNRLLAYEELSRGTIDGASVYPREVVKAALKHNAASVILAHNHPSGVAEPSGADQAITQRLKSALSLMDIGVLDHIIVGEANCSSFAELGLL